MAGRPRQINQQPVQHRPAVRPRRRMLRWRVPHGMQLAAHRGAQVKADVGLVAAQ